MHRSIACGYGRFGRTISQTAGRIDRREPEREQPRVHRLALELRQVRPERAEHEQADQRDLGGDVHERTRREVEHSAMALEGTVALVTGASSGIGEATARALAAQRREGRGRRAPQGPARRARGRDRRARDRGRRHRSRAGDRRRRADGVRARPARHRDQQRRRDAARADRRRAGRGVGPDGRAQRPGPALRRPRRARRTCCARRSPTRAASPTSSTSARSPAAASASAAACTS